MLWKTLVGIGGLAVALGVSGCASSGSGTSEGARSGAMVSAQNVSGVGDVLVNTDGHTLYFADQETSGNIYCTGACLKFWTPLTVASGTTPTAGSGVSGNLATINRPDGKAQVTYDGKPLYTFSLDTAAGKAQGNGFKDAFDGTQFMWHAAAVTGAASAAPSSSGYSNGYGY